MRPEQPEIAGTADRYLRRFGDVLPAAAVALVTRIEREQLVEFRVGEADQRQVEIVGRQLLQLAGEQRLVPR